ncbi:MAG: DUF1122 family protein [Methanotrichaceae archaeon]
MLEDIVQRTADGIDIDGTKAYARSIRSCSLRGAHSLEVYLKDGASDIGVFCMAIFPGRGPRYRPWIDIFCINYEYYDSDIENALLEAFCSALGPGEKIFIEYYCDHETSYGLAMGIPPVLSRQGYKLFNLGFTWFKDWYFSEGGHEGGQKLQGEKPLDKAARIKHLKQMKGEIQSFVDSTRDENINDENQRDDSIKIDGQKYLIRARERAKEVLARIDAELNESCDTTIPEKATLVYQGSSQ